MLEAIGIITTSISAIVTGLLIHEVMQAEQDAKNAGIE